jgi:thiamine kinase-like enzyme
LTNQLFGLPRSTNDPQRQGLPDDSPVFFTHADLNLVNIIVSSPDDGPARVLAIIDWHQSGWYPAYWEYCKALGQSANYLGWRDCLETILAPHNKFIRAWDHYARAAGY